jgi:hypothetical protein
VAAPAFWHIENDLMINLASEVQFCNKNNLAMHEIKCIQPNTKENKNATTKKHGAHFINEKKKNY